MEPRGAALVTGANRGLGLAIAVELARRGFDVVASVRDPASADALRGMEVVQLDMTDLDGFEPPAGLRVVVNNAGFRGQYLPIEEASLEEWRRTFETNVFGVVDLCRRVIPAMRAAGEGVICNIGSTGVFAPMPFYASYRASKAALTILSETLSIELAPFGIRVIEIPIGGVDTDMFRDSLAVRPAEASAFEAYRPMAERQSALTAAMATPGAPPEVAAARVVDAILTEEGPLVRPCDPNADGMLAAVAETTAEERRRAMAEAVVP